MLGTIANKNFCKRIYLSSFALLFYIFPLLGQEASNISIQYTNYNTEDGLPNQLTNCTFQDSKGFFWIATNYGFSRFDGKSFVNYSPEKLGVSFRTITDIFEDKEGNLWLSEMSHENSQQKRRIFIFNPDTETIKAHSTVKPYIYYSIANTPEQKILLGTGDGELLEYDGQKQRVVYTPEDKNPIIQIVAGAKHYWLNSGEKLTLINSNGELLREWSSSNSYALIGRKEENVYVKDIFLSSENELQDRILLFEHDNPSPEIAAVNRLNDASNLSEIWEYFANEEKFVVYNHPGGLSFLEENGENRYLLNPTEGEGMSFNVEHVYFCQNGLLWISSITGVYKIQITPSKFEPFLNKEEPLNFSMRSIVPVGDSLYCNTYSGNIIYDIKKKEIVERFPKGKIGDGLSGIKASDGCIYLAGTGSALQQICERTREETFFYHEDYSINSKTTPRDYWAILEDSKSKIWLGTNQGLSFLDREKGVLQSFKKYNQFTQLSETLVFEIIETDTEYWIAADNGLYKMEADKGITAWFHIGEPTIDSKYLPTDVIVDIYEDEEGYLWLTTIGSGLIRFNPRDASYNQITADEDDLAHNVTNDILEDDFENLWISTNKGLVCLNRKTGDFVNFDKSNGLHIDEFNKKSSAKLEDGRFVFGGLNGFVVFHPKDFLEEEVKEVKSNLRIIKVVIGDSIRNAIDTKQPIILDNNETAVTFDLHLLEFGNEAPATYEWKWKGDAKFTTLPRYLVHLPEIPLGESTVVFRAKSATGVPALNELELSFSTPPLLSPLQIIIAIIALFTLYFLFFRAKKSKVKIDTKPTQVIIIEEKEEPQETAKKEPKNAEKENSKAKLVILSPVDKKWLDTLTNAIKESEHIGQFSVEDMANEMNLSSRQLNRKVKQLAGITPNQFLRDIKLNKAKTLLESGQVATVAEASFAVGFEKPDYFSRLFQEKYGRRPVTYFDRKKG